jgi:outer membrane lipoprotein-sorting protein
MIKIITWITKIIVIVLTALFFSGCHFDYNSLKGSGNITTENRTITEKFTGIEVSSAIELTIEQSDKTEIVVEADDNLQNTILTEVKNGKLIISNKSYTNIHDGTRKVFVKMPVIDGLEASSAATITSKNTLKGNQIYLKSSSAATINLNKLEMDAIVSNSSSGSNIKLKGLTLKLETTASSGSSIRCSQLLANEVIADASSGSNIEVHPIVSLKAEASSGASINYVVAPKTINQKSSSGGSINQY